MEKITDSKDSVDWLKVLNEYGKHQNAYKEHIDDLEFMNPYVFVWSETSNMPMPNPTVDPNDLETWTAVKEAAKKEYSQIVKFEKTLGIKPGRMVTADVLARLAPPGVTASVLAGALGVSASEESLYGDSFEKLMARRMYEMYHGITKSIWNAPGVDVLRKNEPFAGEHISGRIDPKTGKRNRPRWGLGEKAGMRVRWDAAHKYMKPVVVTGSWNDLDQDDKVAIMIAHKMLGKMDELKGHMQSGQDHKWVIHTWLRPSQERFFLQGIWQYIRHRENAAGDSSSRLGAAARARALSRAKEHVAQVEEERRRIVSGELKPFKLTERYKPDHVQPGTKAALNIQGDGGHHSHNKIDHESVQLVPEQGQSEPTKYAMHDNEHQMMKKPRSQPGITGARAASHPDAAGGIRLPEMYDAIKLIGMSRQQPEFQGMRARQSKRINAGLGQVPLSQWKDWHSWDKRPGESLQDFEARKRDEFKNVRSGTPNPAGWRQMVQDVFVNREIETSRGRIKVNTIMRQRLDRAAARIAVDNSVIRTEAEWAGLSWPEKYKYYIKVFQELHKNAHSDIYGTAEERAEARSQHGRTRLDMETKRRSAREAFVQDQQARADRQRRNRAGNRGTGAPVPQEQAESAPQATVNVDQPIPQSVPRTRAKAEARIAQINRILERESRIATSNRQLARHIDELKPIADRIHGAETRLRRIMRASGTESPEYVRAFQNFNRRAEEWRQALGPKFSEDAARIRARRVRLDKLRREQSRRSSSLERSLRKLRFGLAKSIVSEAINKHDFAKKRNVM